MMRFVSLYCLFAAKVFSSTITPSTFAGAYLCLDQAQTVPLSCNVANVGPGSTSTASLNGSYGSAQGANTTVNSTSNIGYGVFHVSDSTTLNITGAPTLALSYAAGNFQDLITIDYAPFTGQQGFIVTDWEGQNPRL
jgi:hypothetical protein